MAKATVAPPVNTNDRVVRMYVSDGDIRGLLIAIGKQMAKQGRDVANAKNPRDTSLSAVFRYITLDAAKAAGINPDRFGFSDLDRE